MTTLQTLPPLARRYSAKQLAEIEAAQAAIRQQWRRVGTNFDAGWMLIRPTVTAILLEAQRRLAQRANEFTPAILEDTGQTRALKASGEINIDAIVGVTGAGYQVADVLSTAPIRAKQGIAEGLAAYQALSKAGEWLERTSGGVLSDTVRTTQSLGSYTHAVAGYVRMVNGGACGRCVLLAGKWFRKNRGFSRHSPTCRCFHIPAGENVAGDWQTDPRAYFDALDPSQQAKLVGGIANAQAVHDGADIGRIINAYRPNAGMRMAQMGSVRVVDGMKFSNRESVAVFFGTKRSAGTGRRLREVSVSKPQRLMPETIAQLAKDDADRLLLLKRHHWIIDHEFEALSPGDRAMALYRRRNDPLF